MIKITVEKDPVMNYDETSEGLRYSASAEFKTAVEECSDPKSVVNAIFDAMRLEGYTDYGIVKTMSEFVEDNLDIIYAHEGFCEDEDEDEFEDFRQWLEDHTLVRGIDYE